MRQSPSITYGQLLRMAASRLPASSTPMLDARLLIQKAAGLSHTDLIAKEQDAVTDDIQTAFLALLAKREEGAPIAHLLGQQEFFGRPFIVSPDVLIPRPETEMIIEAALDLSPRPQTVLDLGTGSGCIVVTLLLELSEVTGLAVDLSTSALDITRQNAVIHGVQERLTHIEGDFAKAPDQYFDLIVSNPPYIEEGAELPLSVKEHEPALALYAGEDGLRAYRQLAPIIEKRLAPAGSALLELGTGQGDSVTQIMQSVMPDRPISVRQDLAGHDRLLTIGRKGAPTPPA